MGMAPLLNALSASTDVHTFLYIESQDAELFVHYSRAEPSELRIELSPAFVALKQARRRPLA